MSVDWNALFGIVGLLNIVGATILTAVFWRLRGEFATKKELASIINEMKEHSDRLTILETHTKEMPTAAAVERLTGDIKVTVERLAGAIKNLERVERTIMRHEDILAGAAREAKR